MKSKPIVSAGLMLVSAGSGCLDVLSYRFLGEVFPSAMTGNLALLGRSLGEGDIGAASRNLSAFGGFFAGALFGAALLGRAPAKGRFLLTLALEAAVLLLAAAVWDRQAAGVLRLSIIGAAAIAMGMQSAVAHRIGIHAVSTTYFTGTTANIAFGLAAGGTHRQVFWPIVALCCYLGGAALAGWSIVGAGFPHLPMGLEALPVLTTAALWLAIAVVRLEPPAGTPETA